MTAAALYWRDVSGPYGDLPPQPGAVTYYDHRAAAGWEADVLLHWSPDGHLDGVLRCIRRIPPGLDSSAVGQLAAYVEASARRQGIGLALFDGAWRRGWVDLDRQEFSPGGAAVVNAYARQDASVPHVTATRAALP